MGDGNRARQAQAQDHGHVSIPSRRGGIESVECSTGMEWWNGHVSEKVFPLCCTQTPARDHQQYVSKKVFEPWLQLLPLSTGEGGGGRGEIFEIVAENWWLTLTQGFIEGGPLPPLPHE